MQETINIEADNVIISVFALAIGPCKLMYLANYFEVSFKMNRLPNTVPAVLKIDYTPDIICGIFNYFMARLSSAISWKAIPKLVNSRSKAKIYDSCFLV